MITAENPHETSLVLPGPPGGLKDLSFYLFDLFFSLLGTSNAQVGGVIGAQCHRDKSLSRAN